MKRSRRWDGGIATVVFSSTEAVAGTLDVEAGPCATGPGAKKPLVSIHLQHEGDRLEDVAALYTVLTANEAAGAWDDVVEAGKGRLATFTDEYRLALARLGHSEGIAAQTEAATRWLAARRWPKGQLVSGLTTRIVGFVNAATTAEENGTPLYCWAGPAVSVYTLASGPAGTYEAYKQRERNS